MAKQWRYCLVFTVVCLIVAGLTVRWICFPGRAFERIAWQDKTQVEQGVRLRMADRLIARGILLGKTQSEILELLGEPSSSGYFADWDMVYWLGNERDFISIDSEWLVLRLAANGRVTDNRIVRD
jgi:hypothetical protein